MITLFAFARSITATLLLTSASMAAPLSLEIRFDVAQRVNDVRLACAALNALRAPTRPVDQYRKGICELYILPGKAHGASGLQWLRAAALADHVEAIVALGDYLQTRSPDEQSEALQWYHLAQQAGDARAAGRYEQLLRRLSPPGDDQAPESSSTQPAPPAGTVINPSAADLKKLYGAGYHCHRMGMGQRWCHDVVDGP